MQTTIQIIGSLVILVPFVLVQVGKMSPQSRSFLVLNIVGSLVLAVDAALGRQWGFLLLEGVWTIVSMIGLIGATRARQAVDR